MTRRLFKSALEELVQLSEVRKQVAAGELAIVNQKISKIDARISDVRTKAHYQVSPETAFQAERWKDWQVQEQARLNIEKSRHMLAQRGLLLRLGRMNAEHEVVLALRHKTMKHDANVAERRKSYTS